MKVGILTFPHAPSLGAMLQMGALYHTIQTQGHDVEIINYVGNGVNHAQKQSKTVKSVAIQVASTLLLKSGKKSFRQFESKMKMHPAQPISEPDELKELAKRYDRIIVGSDQVWNHIVTGNDMNFYLAFCDKDEKKASYAASFGNTQIIEESREQITGLLNAFTYLGVREKQGQQLIKNLTGRESKVVLDPTLLTTREYLLSEMIPANRKKKYVLFFQIKPSASLRKRAEEYAEENGLELVTVGGRIKERLNPRKHPAFGVGPGEFLGLIQDAQCVFTNSFHGLAISIALQREFYVEYSTDTNSRLINLVEMLDLQDRVITQQPLKAVAINYETVDEKLQVQRDYSQAFLQEILTEK